MKTEKIVEGIQKQYLFYILRYNLAQMTEPWNFALITLATSFVKHSHCPDFILSSFLHTYAYQLHSHEYSVIRKCNNTDPSTALQELNIL